jgi:nucleoside 2-deoxyribosyltransferase
VNSKTTVGTLKEDNELVVQYSSDLTEEQIAEINTHMVEAGDWALISVMPFDTPETLTITMNNGDQFVLRNCRETICIS